MDVAVDAVAVGATSTVPLVSKHRNVHNLIYKYISNKSSSCQTFYEFNVLQIAGKVIDNFRDSS